MIVTTANSVIGPESVIGRLDNQKFSSRLCSRNATLRAPSSKRARTTSRGATSVTSLLDLCSTTQPIGMTSTYAFVDRGEGVCSGQARASHARPTLDPLAPAPSDRDGARTNPFPFVNGWDARPLSHLTVALGEERATYDTRPVVQTSDLRPSPVGDFPTGLPQVHGLSGDPSRAIFRHQGPLRAGL